MRIRNIFIAKIIFSLFFAFVSDASLRTSPQVVFLPEYARLPPAQIGALEWSDPVRRQDFASARSIVPAGWRLPTVYELYALSQQHSALRDEEFFWYRSSSPAPISLDGTFRPAIWVVDFNAVTYGEVGMLDQDSHISVRFVRTPK